MKTIKQASKKWQQSKWRRRIITTTQKKHSLKARRTKSWDYSCKKKSQHTTREIFKWKKKFAKQISTEFIHLTWHSVFVLVKSRAWSFIALPVRKIFARAKIAYWIGVKHTHTQIKRDSLGDRAKERKRISATKIHILTYDVIKFPIHGMVLWHVCCWMYLCLRVWFIPCNKFASSFSLHQLLLLDFIYCLLSFAYRIWF